MTDSYIYLEQGGASPDAPLIFTLHGTGGDETQFHGFAQETLPGAQIVSPRGDVSEGGMNRYFKRTGMGVYDMDDLALRTEKLAQFMRGFKGDSGRKTLALGYSNGANIIANLLFAYPDLLDGAVLMHPLIPFDPAPQPGLAGRRILVTAGRSDGISPEGLTEKLLAYFEHQNADVTADWHHGGHEVHNSEIAAITAFLAPYRDN